jgi:hypothetical protein
VINGKRRWSRSDSQATDGSGGDYPYGLPPEPG